MITKKPAKRPAVEQRAAYHEAGHAVVAYFVNRSVTQVSIDAGKGVVEMSAEKPRRFDCEWGCQNEEEIMLCLAGMLAVLIHKRRKGYITASDIGSGSNADWEHISRLANDRLLLPYPATDCDSEREAYLRWLEIRTRNLLKKAWCAVEMLAESLLASGRLSGAAAIGVIKRGLTRQYDLEHVNGDWRIVKPQTRRPVTGVPQSGPTAHKH